MAHALNWFEIPVIDMNRAVKFYSTVLGRQLQEGEVGGAPYTFLISDEEVVAGGVGGALTQVEGATPGDTGTLVYLKAGDDLAVGLAKVEDAGGKIIVPKTSLGPLGFFAIVIDTEGNKVGLHSSN